MDLAREINDPELIKYANTVLIVAVISIIITSPIGAILIMQLGPRLLHRNLPEQNEVRGITNAAADIEETRRL